MIKIVLFLVATLSFGQSYTLSSAEREGLAWAFGESFASQIKVEILDHTHFPAYNVISAYDFNTDTIRINADKLEVFRRSYTIFHEAAHRYQYRIMGYSPVFTTTPADYVVSLSSARITFEQQAEILRLLTIDHLGVSYVPRQLNDQFLPMSDGTRSSLMDMIRRSGN